MAFITTQRAALTVLGVVGVGTVYTGYMGYKFVSTALPYIMDAKTKEDITGKPVHLDLKMTFDPLSFSEPFKVVNVKMTHDIPERC